MNTPIVYLSGPMAGLTIGSSTAWRKEVAERMGWRVELLDPTREFSYLAMDSDKILDLGQLVETGDPITSPGAIVTRDMTDVRRSNLVLVNLLDSINLVSIGTVSEIGWALAWDIPVVVAMRSGNVHDHPMVTGRSIVTDTLDEAINISCLILNR